MAKAAKRSDKAPGVNTGTSQRSFCPLPASQGPEYSLKGLEAAGSCVPLIRSPG